MRIPFAIPALVALAGLLPPALSRSDGHASDAPPRRLRARSPLLPHEAYAYEWAHAAEAARPAREAYAREGAHAPGWSHGLNFLSPQGHDYMTYGRGRPDDTFHGAHTAAGGAPGRPRGPYAPQRMEAEKAKQRQREAEAERKEQWKQFNRKKHNKPKQKPEQKPSQEAPKQEAPKAQQEKEVEPPKTATRKMTHYDVLGIDKSATDVDIRKAYKKLALQHHPDHFPAEEREAATERFKFVNTAYQTLSDPGKRMSHDKQIRVDTGYFDAPFEKPK